MSNVVDLNLGPQRKGVKWVPKHLDERVATYFERNTDFKSPIMYLLDVMNGQVRGADTVEDRIDAAKTLMPYFHSKAPVIEADEIKDIKADIDNVKDEQKKQAVLQSHFTKLGLNVMNR